MATGMVQIPLEWDDEWAHGKFQNAFESVHSGHTVGVHILEWALRVGVRVRVHEYEVPTAREREVPRQ